MMSNRQTASAFQRNNNSSTYRSAANTVFPQHRVTVAWYNSVWAQELKPKLNELTSLRHGWDGYAGNPVSWDCATFAANLLERIYVEGLSIPSLVPGSDGTLQIEWHKNNYDIEIDVLGANKVIATKFDHLSGAEEVLDLDNDFSAVVTWVYELSTERLNLAAATS